MNRQWHLSGRTHKGKNRVREHGASWTPLRPNADGEWLCIPTHELGNPRAYMRWIHPKSDEHFTVS